MARFVDGGLGGPAGGGGDPAAGPERATGSLDGAAGLGAGDHVCWIYQSEDERRRVLTEFFTEGAAPETSSSTGRSRGGPARFLALTAQALGKDTRVATEPGPRWASPPCG